MDLDLFFTVNRAFHILGAILGTGAATFVEIFYLKAIRDGKIESFEAEDLKVFYFILRLTLIILIISGFGILVVWRLNLLGPDFFYNPRLWAKYTIVLVILINAILIQMRKMPMWLGSSLSLVSWWTAFILGGWRTLAASYFEIIFGYILAVIVVGFILDFIKKKILFSPKT